MENIVKSSICFNCVNMVITQTLFSISNLSVLGPPSSPVLPIVKTDLSEQIYFLSNNRTLSDLSSENIRPQTKNKPHGELIKKSRIALICFRISQKNGLRLIKLQPFFTKSVVFPVA